MHSIETQPQRSTKSMESVVSVLPTPTNKAAANLADGLLVEFVSQIENQIQSDDEGRINEGLTNFHIMLQSNPSFIFSFQDPQMLINRIIMFLESPHKMFVTLSTKIIIQIIEDNREFAEKFIISPDLANRMVSLFPSYLAIRCFMYLYSYQQISDNFPRISIQNQFIRFIRNLPRFNPLVESIVDFFSMYRTSFTLEQNYIPGLLNIIIASKEFPQSGVLVLRLFNVFFENIKSWLLETDFIPNLIQTMITVGYKFLIKESLKLFENIASIDGGIQYLSENGVLRLFAENLFRYDTDADLIPTIDFICFMAEQGDEINNDYIRELFVKTFDGTVEKSYRMKYHVYKMAYTFLLTGNENLCQYIDPKQVFMISLNMLQSYEDEFRKYTLETLLTNIQKSDSALHELCIEAVESEEFTDTINSLVNDQNKEISILASSILDYLAILDI